MELQRIIEDSTLSTEAKVILLTAEIEKRIRSAPAEEVEVKLMCEETVFHTYHTPYIPRVGELVLCQLTIGKGQLATLWQVQKIEHGVEADRLRDVIIVVQPADTQTAMYWQRWRRSNRAL
jgi:hypothetical protein